MAMTDEQQHSPFSILISIFRTKKRAVVKNFSLLFAERALPCTKVYQGSERNHTSNANVFFLVDGKNVTKFYRKSQKKYFYFKKI